MGTTVRPASDIKRDDRVVRVDGVWTVTDVHHVGGTVSLTLSREGADDIKLVHGAQDPVVVAVP